MPVALLLSFAIVTEVAGTIALRYSDGFTKLGPSALVVLGYGTSFWLLALVLRELSVGTTYAVWSAVGTALIAAFGNARARRVGERVEGREPGAHHHGRGGAQPGRIPLARAATRARSCSTRRAP
jgi:multidrug transporter EmrE-like cation transporter